MTTQTRVDLFGEVTSKRESYEDPALVYPYDSKLPKKLRTQLTIELDGYANNKGVAGQAKLGTVYVSVDGTDALAQLTAGKRITLTLAEAPVTDNRALATQRPDDISFIRQTPEDAIRDIGGSGVNFKGG